MDAKTIQGRDNQIRLMRNGNLVKIIAILSFNHNQDADFTRSNYLGMAESVGDISHKGWSGNLEAETPNSVMDDLIDDLIEQNLGRLDVDDITILDIENYRDGTKAGWVYYGVQLKYSKTAGAKDEKVKKKLDWQSDKRKRIF